GSRRRGRLRRGALTSRGRTSSPPGDRQDGLRSFISFASVFSGTVVGRQAAGDLLENFLARRYSYGRPARSYQGDARGQVSPTGVAVAIYLHKNERAPTEVSGA